MAGGARPAELASQQALKTRPASLALAQVLQHAMTDLVFLFGFWVAVLVTADLVIRTVLGLAGGVVGAIGRFLRRPFGRVAAA